MKKSEVQEYILELKDNLKAGEEEFLEEFETFLLDSPNFVSFTKWKKDSTINKISRKYIKENQSYLKELQENKVNVTVTGYVDGVTVDRGIIESFGKNYVTLVGGRPMTNVREVVPTTDYIIRLVEFPDLMKYAQKFTTEYQEQLKLYTHFTSLVYDEDSNPTREERKSIVEELINSTEGQLKLEHEFRVFKEKKKINN